MTENNSPTGETITIKSVRFGELTVPKESVIEFPAGLVGFAGNHRFVMLDHKPPFAWLHSVDDPALAFVVIDGFEFGQTYNFKPPLGDKETDFKEGDEYALLIIVTVRPDPKMTTGNLKAPLFINLKNRRGVQIIIDDPNLSTRHSLWAEETQEESKEESKK